MDISLFLIFIKEVICSGDDFYYNIVVTFFSQIIQEPQIKHNTALILLAGKGAGKGTFVNAMAKVLANYYLSTADPDKILGKFNEHISRALLIYANESFFVGDRKNEGKLKNFISETETTYEIKGGAIFSGKNLSRLVVDSNDDNVIKETADERRFIYAKISAHRQGDEKYFEQLNRVISDDRFPESLMHFLYFFNFKPYERYLKFPPRNEIAIEQQLQNLNDIESWWLACIQEGEILNVAYVLEGDGIRISNESLYESFRLFTQKKGKKIYDGIENFGKLIKKHVISEDLIIKDTIKDNNKKNAKVYGSLKDCQQYFIKKQKLENYIFEQFEWKESTFENKTFSNMIPPKIPH